ncbi:hypothetical protein NHX12_027862 [Muraenolepis orangiensis]|uniref:Uncharacterized protein n=1 Tax=Muraenolepis orangiensis TaxID=630683 RepID=A0A9Q0IPM7_9TELE|nr:hypothetical protein NHX12_027862 [Muraenolepis orangiensis]
MKIKSVRTTRVTCYYNSGVRGRSRRWLYYFSFSGSCAAFDQGGAKPRAPRDPSWLGGAKPRAPRGPSWLGGAKPRAPRGPSWLGGAKPRAPRGPR